MKYGDTILPDANAPGMPNVLVVYEQKGLPPLSEPLRPLSIDYILVKTREFYKVQVQEYNFPWRVRYEWRPKG